MITEKYPKVELSSYGFHKASSYVCTPQCYEEVLQCIAFAKQNELKICPAGSRLSFSNVCLISEGISIDMRMLNKVLEIDLEKKTAKVQAGLLTTQLLAMIMPLGYIIKGLTGSLKNTIGGDIANDVNGKDSWKYGHFGENVIALKIALSDGTIAEYTKEQNPEIFDAVIGGLGLIGVVLEVTLQLIEIPSFILTIESKKQSGIAGLVDYMNNLSHAKYEYAYCWTDPFAPKQDLGRGICETAYFKQNGGLVEQQKLLNGFIQKNNIGPFSPATFWSIFKTFDSSFGFSIASSLKYNLSGNSTHEAIFSRYQYPMLKYFPEWNLKYAPLGFREWQLLFPNESFTTAYTTILLFCRKHKITPYICAVRKHKKQSAFLSFSGEGFSMTVNYGLSEIKPSSLKQFEEEFLSLILSLKGKVYIGKHPFFDRTAFLKMYEKAPEFMVAKNKYDKLNLFWSDAANSLFIEK